MYKKILIVPVIILFLAIFLPIASQLPVAFAVNEEAMPLELDGTEWVVTMSYMSKKGKKITEEDKLIFSDKKFISEEFEDRGYDPTNYSLTLEEDGTTKFGTMQVKGKDTSFWKGTIQDGSISGSVHTQFNGGKRNQTVYFSGSISSGQLKEKPAWKPTTPLADQKPTPPPVPVTVEQTAVEGQNENVEIIQDSVGNNGVNDIMKGEQMADEPPAETSE